MLKHASDLCLIAALIAVGAMVGYRQGLASASRLGTQPVVSSAATSQGVVPERAAVPEPAAADLAADPAIAAIALMQRAAAPSCTLDSTSHIPLFGVADVASQHLVIIGCQPISDQDLRGPGHFNFQIGYQF